MSEETDENRRRITGQHLFGRTALFQRDTRIRQIESIPCVVSQCFGMSRPNDTGSGAQALCLLERFHRPTYIVVELSRPPKEVVFDRHRRGRVHLFNRLFK